MKKIYLDNAAAAPLSSELIQYLYDLFYQFYNPSSQYQDGKISKTIIEKSRLNVANFVSADKDDIIFTSSGSASNTLAIKGYVQKHNCSVLYMPTLHKSILKCVENIKKSYPLKVDSKGFLNFYDLKEWLDTNEKFLVVIEFANSELGTIQPVKKIIDLCHFYNAKVYVDCTGSISQLQLNQKVLDADMFGFSAHKLGSLKGCGILYKKKDIELEPLVYGIQENGLFGGTENLLSIASIGKVCELYNYSKCCTSRNYVYSYINKNISNTYLIGCDLDDRLPCNLYMCIKNVNSESLMTLMDLDGIQIGTGSACNSGNKTPSTTLLAIGLEKEDLYSCIRLTFSGYESIEELNYICETLNKNITKLRSFN